MTLREFFDVVWHMLIGREHGPLHFRFVLQPLVATMMAIRFGIADARAGRPAFFFWGVFTDPKRRPELLHSAWKHVGKVFLVAVTLDIVYEVMVYRWIYPTETLIVAVVLAFVPYLLVRGPVTRIARRLLRRHEAQDSELN